VSGEERAVGPPQLTHPTPLSPEFTQVLALGKQAKATVGFLSDSAFAQRGRQGTLLAATVDGVVVAYVLYDLPRDEIRIVQLVVAPKHRGRGLARILVDSLAEEHIHRRGIFLSCRNDFAADGLWPQLDFVPLRERTGRNLDGKPLTRWFRSFGQPDLFTLLHEHDTRPIAVMDTCVFFDLVAERQKPFAQQLRADWLVEHVRFAVADQLLVEIHNGKDAQERERQTAATEFLRLPSRAVLGWRSVYDSLRDAHPTAPEGDLHDLKHVAQSIGASAAWLITTDRRFVRRYGKTAMELGGLRVLLASEFLREVDKIARGDRYRPIDLAGTAVTRREADAEALPGLAREFVNHPAGERIRDLRATIERAAAHPLGFRIELVEVDGIRRGLVCWLRTNDGIDVLAARVTAGSGEPTIGRHLLAMVRDKAIAEGVPTIRIRDEHPSPGVQGSFRDEGFALAPQHDDTVVAHTLDGRGTLAELYARAIALGSPLANTNLFEAGENDLVDRAAAAERWFAPFIVTDAGIPSFFVPIQHGFATDLVDVGLAEDQLLPRPWRLGLRRELVYYRSPRNSGGLAAPARLVWYVSGTAPGAGSIRAVSHLSEVIIDAHRRLFHRFEPLGVYRADEVRRVADANGIAMAMRFNSTRRVGPIPLDDYREILTGDRKSKDVVLRSIRPMSERTFVTVLDFGCSRAA
jgi:predicted GNAT family acetyltransferase